MVSSPSPPSICSMLLEEIGADLDADGLARRQVDEHAAGVPE